MGGEGCAGIGGCGGCCWEFVGGWGSGRRGEEGVARFMHCEAYGFGFENVMN